MSSPVILPGATALITGASSGIGQAVALSLRQQGASVIATVRSASDGEILRKAGCRIEILDVRDYAAQAAMIDHVGAVDILINNAAVSYRSSIEHGNENIIREIFDVNFFAPCALVRRIVPGMRKRRNGAIVNVSSVSGRIAQPLNGYYAATKHALEAATEALAYELRPFNIRVVLIEPGRIKTNLHSRLRAEPRTYEDSTSDYWQLTRQLPPNVTGGADPSIVASTVISALTAPEPGSMRWPASPDAIEVLSLLKSMSDSDFERYLFRRLNIRNWLSQRSYHDAKSRIMKELSKCIIC